MPLSSCCRSLGSPVTIVSGAPVGFSVPGVMLYPLDRLRVRQIDIAVAQRDAGGAAAAEGLLHLNWPSPLASRSATAPPPVCG